MGRGRTTRRKPPKLPPHLAAAAELERDLGISADEAIARVTAQSAENATEPWPEDTPPTDTPPRKSKTKAES